jgi:hypothetical protein
VVRWQHLRRQGRLLDVVHGADGRGEDFGFKLVIVIDLADLLDQFHAVEAMSSSRPMNGDMKVAPALAASRA